MAEGIALDLAKGVLGKLTPVFFQQIALWWNLKDDVEDLKSTVSAINAVLLDAHEKSVTNHAVKDWLEKLKDVLYHADDLLDDFSTEAFRRNFMGGNKLTNKVRIFFSSSNQFAYGLKMGRQIKAIKSKLKSIKSEIEMLKLVERDRPTETTCMAKRREQGHSFVMKGEIIGREDDKKALLELIFSDSEENLLIIPIVGFGGLGKTALAQLVYNDDLVSNQFELRMWVCVSDVFNVKIIVENIIKSATDKAPKNLDMDQLQKQLRDKIDGKRYLLVLDDVWNEDWENWFSLKKLLMGGARGSRIIVTTRSQRVAKVTSACVPYVLNGLSDDHAWNLFKEIAFEQRPADSINPTFLEIGKKVLEKCGGVPLVIRTIASTLSFKETESEWLSFKDNELATVSQQQEGDTLPTLKLSYDHLPSPLKHCFAYCRLYPKDYEIEVETLIQLWIAEGFVEHSNNPNKSLEDIGFGYFNELAQRSFFQEVEGNYGDMFCKMHDSMHDLAISVAGAGSTILYSNSSASAINEKCRHVSIDFSLIPSHEISIPLFRAKNLRTLLQCGNRRLQFVNNETCSSIISNFRCLRALDLSLSHLDKVPTSIHKLKHLRYLDLSENDALKTLPNSFCKIQNLQVLKLDRCDGLQKLPENIGNLVNLTHLELNKCDGLTHMPRGIGKLTSLRTLSRFVVDKDGSHGADLIELGGLNNLRGELIITNLGYVKNAKEKFQGANLKEKANLQSLTLEWGQDIDDHEKSLEDLQPHPNLKQLYITGWRGNAKFPSWISSLTNLTNIEITGPSKFKNLPTVHQLPHLEELCIYELRELEYMDHNLGANPEGGQGEAELLFPSLTNLHLVNCPKLKSWWRNINDDNGTTTTTRAFPRLSKLHIENCPLTAMPLYPSLEEGLLLRNTSSRPLLQTMNISMQSNTDAIPSSLPLSKLKQFDVVDVEGVDIHLLQDCLQNLTSLESLGISSVPCSLDLDLDGTQLESLRNLSYLTIENITEMVSLPSWLQHLIGLEYLSIQNCNRLTSLFPVFAHLTSLQLLNICGCKELELSAPDSDTQIFQHYRSLRTLVLSDIPKCRHLPEWLQHLTNLRTLCLYDLPNLTSLPDEIRRLTNLEVLSIASVPQLSEGCRKDIGTYWPKIAHIPYIKIDKKIVQNLRQQ